MITLDAKSSKWASVVKRPTSKLKPFGVDISSAPSDAAPSSKEKKDVAKFLQYSFQMDSIILNLFTGIFRFCLKKYMIVLISLLSDFKAPNEGLASFGIHFLSLKGHKLVDESMSASVVLCDVQLDDIRPGRQNLITKYVQSRSSVFLFLILGCF